MSAAPSVSVCITTYNQAEYIEQCISSALCQHSCADVEVLVGDDGSTDATREIISRMAQGDHRVRPFMNDIRMGPAANLQQLVAAASGEFIAHLDGDDTWRPDKLMLQLDALDDRQVVAVYSNATVVSPDGSILGRFNSCVDRRIDMRELFRRGNFLNHSSLIYRASAREAILGMAAPFIDYRIHFRMLAHGELAYVPDELVRYRWRSPGSMVKTMPDAVANGQVQMLKEMIAVGVPAECLRSAAAPFWGRAVILAAVNGDSRAALRVSRSLRDLTASGIGWKWLAWHAFLSPFRAIQSVRSRRRGVFFP